MLCSHLRGYLWWCLSGFLLPLFSGPWAFEVMWLALANGIQQTRTMSLAGGSIKCLQKRLRSSPLLPKRSWEHIYDGGAEMNHYEESSCGDIAEFHWGLCGSKTQTVPVLSHRNPGVVCCPTSPSLSECYGCPQRALWQLLSRARLGRKMLLLPAVSHQLHLQSGRLLKCSW